MDLPIEQYYAHAFALHDAEREAREELTKWLPDDLIDAHAHCNLPEHVERMHPHTRGHMLSTFPYFSLTASRELQGLFYPGKRVRSLRFPKTFRGLNHRAANEYLLAHSPAADRVALFGLPEDFEYTARMLRHPRVSALKMYWSYVDPPAKTIYEFFPPNVLEEAQSLDLPIILHLPKMIVASINDLMRLIRDFPRLRIVLAHLGLSKLSVPGLSEAMRKASTFDTVFMDTALNPSVEVAAMALMHFGPERILFGSDEPLNLIRSVAYRHPVKGERIVTDIRYHWTDGEEFAQFGHLAQNAPHAHWQSLRALISAIRQLPHGRQTPAFEWVFRQTATNVYGF